MPRPKGSKNKSTLAREAAAKQKTVRSDYIDCDKNGVVTAGDTELGTIQFEDSVFVAQGFGKQTTWFDYDDALNWFRDKLDQA